MSDNETEDLFVEIQNVGMSDIGTAVEFELNGEQYMGVINDPDAATQMLSGGYQGRSEMVIKATRSQFASNPPQRGEITITSPDIFSASQWRIKQCDVDGSSHYDLTVIKQLPTG